MKHHKNKLSPEKSQELLDTLKARFEKNMSRHKSIEWTEVQAKAGNQSSKNCGRSMKWKAPAVNRMLLAMIKKRANIFFMIVQRKVPKAAEAFVTTVKLLIKGKH